MNLDALAQDAQTFHNSLGILALIPLVKTLLFSRPSEDEQEQEEARMFSSRA
jgi:hypothetical protein